MDILYLSRRNLLTLLSKLDRKAAGENTQCTVIKNQNLCDAFKQTMIQCAVVAVEDDEYYDAQSRPAGIVHPADEPNTTVPKTGLM